MTALWHSLTPTEHAALACIATCIVGLCIGAAWAWSLRTPRVVVVVLPDPDEVYDQEADEALIALRADLDAWGRAS